MQDHTEHTDKNQRAVAAAIAYLSKRNRLHLLAKPLRSLGNGVCLYGCRLAIGAPRLRKPEPPLVERLQKTA
jgi:hypothetical protein